MRLLDNILEEINASLKTNLNGLDEYGNLGNLIQFWREAWNEEFDDINAEGLTFPTVNQGSGSGTRITPDDNYALQVYHRVLDSENVEDTSKGVGKNIHRFRHYSMRMVVIGNINLLPVRTFETNTDLMSLVYQAMPRFMNDPYKESIIMGNEQPNKITMYSEEYAGHNFKHLMLNLLGFYVDYVIQQRSDCGTITNDPIITLNDVAAIVGNANAVV